MAYNKMEYIDARQVFAVAPGRHDARSLRYPFATLSMGKVIWRSDCSGSSEGQTTLQLLSGGSSVCWLASDGDGHFLVSATVHVMEVQGRFEAWWTKRG